MKTLLATRVVCAFALPIAFGGIIMAWQHYDKTHTGKGWVGLANIVTGMCLASSFWLSVLLNKNQSGRN